MGYPLLSVKGFESIDLFFLLLLLLLLNLFFLHFSGLVSDFFIFFLYLPGGFELIHFF